MSRGKLEIRYKSAIKERKIVPFYLRRHNILWVYKKGACFSAYFLFPVRLSRGESCGIILGTHEICEEKKP